MAKILMVDDEQKIRFVVKEYAHFSGHEVTEAENGQQAIAFCKRQNFDIIIIDVMMPRMDGFSAIKEIRRICETPIIILSARGEEYDKLFGFDLGIDDYVVKPFSPKELMARVNAVLARGNKATKEKHQFELDGLVIDITGRRVIVDGKTVSLTPKEYDLLFFMVKNKGIALSRERLITEVWGYDYFGDDRTLDTHIKMLRQNLGQYRSHIITLRSMGYKFDA